MSKRYRVIGQVERYDIPGFETMEPMPLEIHLKKTGPAQRLLFSVPRKTRHQSAADRLHAEIKKIQHKTGVTYAEAYNQVSCSHPELFQAWHQEY